MPTEKHKLLSSVSGNLGAYVSYFRDATYSLCSGGGFCSMKTILCQYRSVTACISVYTKLILLLPFGISTDIINQ